MDAIAWPVCGPIPLRTDAVAVGHENCRDPKSANFQHWGPFVTPQKLPACLSVFLAVVGALVSSGAGAACRSESRMLAMNLSQTSQGPLMSGARFTRAGAYIAAGCLVRARGELDQADTALAREGLSESDTRTRRRAHDALRTYADALQLVEDGRRQAAVDLLLQIMDTSRATDVMWRVTMTLGDLLVAQSRPDEWERFSQSLDQLAKGQAKFWQVDVFRRLKEVRDGQGAASINAVLTELSEELPVQRSLTLQVLLAELLTADGRYSNARIQCVTIDSDVANGLLDTELRLRYLRTCASAWRHQGPNQPGDLPARTLKVYETAIKRFEAEL